jgi:ABC-type cobalamin/Fe3+-siderophores transport system ATPase subunit
MINIKASFRESAPEASFIVSNIEMKIYRSQIMCVVRPVASGKSTLVQGLIGELSPIPTRQQETVFEVNGKVSYASQLPFTLTIN